jgi:hypothetical protein
MQTEHLLTGGAVMRALVIAAALTTGLSGCVAVWGSAWHIEDETPTAVVIRYDAGLMDTWRVQNHANDVCSKYKKIAVPKSQRMGVVLPGGSIAEIVYSCDTADQAALDYHAPLQNMSGFITPAAARMLSNMPDPQPPVYQQPAFVPVTPILPIPQYTAPYRPPPEVPVAGYHDLMKTYERPPPPPPGVCVGSVRVPASAIPCP